LESNSKAIQKPLVSVLLPVFNGEKHIREAIDSILLQTIKNFELIIIDDCSVDSSLKIIQTYNDSRIRLIRNKENSGPGVSLNNGIEQAAGNYIAIMHADDIATPDRFQKQCHFLETNAEIDIVGTQYKQINEVGEAVSVSSGLSTDPDSIEFSTLFNNCLCHPTVMFRASVFRSRFRYAPLRLNEDYELWTRCLTNKMKLANLNDVCLHYRVHQQQASSKFSRQEQDSFIALRHQYRSTRPQNLQALIESVESVSIETLFDVVIQIREFDFPKSIEMIFYNKLSFYIHSIVKQKQGNDFNLRKYFHFLQNAGWRNFRVPIAYRLVVNRSF